MYIYGAIAYYIHNDTERCFCDNIWTGMKYFHRYVPNFMLVIVVFILLRNLKKSFDYEFKRLYMHILGFAIFQLLILSIQFVGWRGGKVVNIAKRTLYWQGYYLILQSLGIIFLKSAKDPLEGISHLGYLQLLSIHQTVNHGFMENQFENMQYKELTIN